jgi:hypothetical protein
MDAGAIGIWDFSRCNAREAPLRFLVFEALALLSMTMKLPPPFSPVHDKFNGWVISANQPTRTNWGVELKPRRAV